LPGIDQNQVDNTDPVTLRGFLAFANQAHEANKPGNPTGNNQYQVKEERKVDNYKHSKTKGGTDLEYLTSVIARDRPISRPGN
jgi:hypothetical protein